MIGVKNQRFREEKKERERQVGDQKPRTQAGWEQVQWQAVRGLKAHKGGREPPPPPSL